LRTRYYDPAVGRFVQEDKIGRAGGLNLYAYAGGRPLAARDPSGTMDDYYLLGEFLWTPPAHNCWGIVCDRDGFDVREGAGGDWNGDGMDDMREFTEYSWGAQHWRNNGGTTEQWRAVWNYGVLRQQNPGLRSALMELAFWGDIRPVAAAHDWLALATEREGNDIVHQSDHVIHLPGRKVYINTNPNRVTLFDKIPWAMTFTLAHEMWHYRLIWQGVPYGGLAEEGDADCYARTTVGWGAQYCR
jgi:hypothetical protein